MPPSASRPWWRRRRFLVVAGVAGLALAVPASVAASVADRTDALSTVAAVSGDNPPAPATTTVEPGATAPAPTAARVRGQAITGSGSSLGDGWAPPRPLRSGFAISGTAHGLYPGAALPLVLTFSNPTARPITVTSVTVTSGAAGSGCPAGLVSSTGLTAYRLVPAHGSVTATIAVTLAEAAPNGCQGAVIPLTYLGTGVTQ